MSNAADLIKLAEATFAKRGSLLNYWQDVAENFYPERADFVSTRHLGHELAEHLTSSYPILARRELGDTFTAMLRPKDREWFHLRASREEHEDNAAKEWMEWASGTMRRAMYDPLAGFTRATKQGDHDFAGFGQCAISVELNRDRNRMLYRNWHLRDVAWRESAELRIDHVFRRWKLPAVDLVKQFRDTHREIKALAEGDKKFEEVDCIHCVIPNDKGQQPYRSIYIDVQNQHIMEDKPSWSLVYVIPRWQTVSGSQYAYSPAVVAALPDARLLQAVTLTLLDAGERYASPPMVAVRQAIRGDIDLQPSGITWVDAEYDERLGEVLRPLTQDARGYPIGTEVREEARAMIADAFFLSKLQLPPPTGRDMTAYEVGQRVQEFIRTTLPLFEPIEDDYNGSLCNATFELGLRSGLFGPLDAIPDSLRGADVRFRFISPLSEAADRQKGQQFLETAGLLAQAVELDPTAPMMLDSATMIRDALEGVGTPATWMRDEDEYAAAVAAHAEQQQMANEVGGVERLAQVGQQVGAAAQSLEGVV